MLDLHNSSKAASKKLKAKGKNISNLAKKNLDAIKKSYGKKLISNFPGDLFDAAFQDSCSSVSQALYQGIYNNYFGE